MDERLRELARSAASGDLEASARLLQERARSGHCSPLLCTVDTHDHNPRVWVLDPTTKKPGQVRRPCKTCDGTGYLPFARGVELAGIVGDPVARLALGWGRFHGPDCKQETIGPRNEYMEHVRARGCRFLDYGDLAYAIYMEGSSPLLVRALLPLFALWPAAPDTDRVLAAAREWLESPRTSEAVSSFSDRDETLPVPFRILIALIQERRTAYSTFTWMRGRDIIRAAAEKVGRDGNGVVRTMIQETVTGWVLA